MRYSEKTTIKETTLKDGTNLIVWYDPHATLKRRAALLWNIKYPNDENIYYGCMFQDYGKECIDSSKDERTREKNIRDIASDHTTRLLLPSQDCPPPWYFTPKEARKIIRPIVEQFLREEYESRKQHREGFKKLGQYVRETALTNSTKDDPRFIWEKKQ